MQWTNKGHQFDQFKKVFTPGRKIYIYGAGKSGADLYRKLKFEDCVEGFIDNIKQGSYLGKKIISIFEFLELEQKKEYMIVIAANQSNTQYFKSQLLFNGFFEGDHIFTYSEFSEFYLPLYYMYSWNKLYTESICCICTTVCNLNCKYCLNFTNYNQNKHHYDISQLKADIDKFFEWVDYVGLFHVSGGEPFLFPDLKELLEYLSQKYQHQIGQIATTANGTVVPDDPLCRIMAKENITLYLDDYRENVLLADKNYASVKKQAEKFGVDIIENHVEQWIAIFPNDNEIKWESEEALCTYFNACNRHFISLHNKKISLCNYSDYAVGAGLCEEHENDFFLLDKPTREGKVQLMEYVAGYSERGYSEFCKKCRGFLAINTSVCSVAEQEGRL